MAVVPSEETRGGKEEEAKIELTFFAKSEKIIAFTTEKRVFGISKNRFCTIPG